MSVAACFGDFLSQMIPRLGYLPRLPGEMVFQWPSISNPIVMLVVIAALTYATVRVRREIMDCAETEQTVEATPALSAAPPAVRSPKAPTRIFERAVSPTHAAERLAKILPFPARRDETATEDRALAA